MRHLLVTRTYPRLLLLALALGTAVFLFLSLAARPRII